VAAHQDSGAHIASQNIQRGRTAIVGLRSIAQIFEYKLASTPVHGDIVDHQHLRRILAA
jgi:hypothetical protein